MANNTPKIIFIIPYRNRLEHKTFFTNYMTSILPNESNEISMYFSHQHDNRPFNRGAVKNIGFLAMKQKYPVSYKQITFVFNDIDTIPFENLFNYETQMGTVKHFYGFENTLGGIVCIKGADFERTNGFPNYWGWGMEDNVFQQRCLAVQLRIDRSVFYPIGSPEVFQLFDGISKLVNSKTITYASVDNGFDGLRTIRQLTYTIDELSTNQVDNRFPLKNQENPLHFKYINISQFTAFHNPYDEKFHEYDMRTSMGQFMALSNNPNTKRETHDIQSGEWVKKLHGLKRGVGQKGGR